MNIALDEAQDAGLDLEVLKVVLANCESLEREGYGDLGTQGLMKFYSKG